MTDRPYPAAAFRAYAAASVQAHGPRQVLLLLHEAMARELIQAKAAYERRALDQMCRHIEACTKILLALTCNLDFAAAGPGGDQLRLHYQRLMRRIGRIARETNVTGSIQLSVGIIQEMCKSFRS